MVLKLSAKELEEAKKYGIDTEKLNAPKVREKIQQAKLRDAGAIVSVRLRKLAGELGVTIKPTDRSQQLRRRLGSKMLELLAKKGLKPRVEFVFSEDNPVYGGLTASLSKMTVVWNEDSPQLCVNIPAKPRTHTISAHIVLDHARVVGK